MSNPNKSPQIVMCENDFPKSIFPEGTTVEQATEYCVERQEQINKGFAYTRIHVHCHLCPIIEK